MISFLNMENQEKEIWIYLSHSYKDYDKVRLIRNYLEEKSYRPLMFYLKCLKTEEETFDLIKREIDVRTRFILCDSKNARDSYWVQKEMDYISNAIPERSYEVIDISKPLEQLKTELDNYTIQTNVYISYPLVSQNMFDKIKKRLLKYDIRVSYPDRDSKLMELLDDYKKNEVISSKTNSGYFILLAGDQSKENSWATEKFEQTAVKNTQLIVIALSENAYEWCNDNKITPVRLKVNKNKKYSDYDNYMADKITNVIISKVLAPGAIVTHGDNFRSGKNASVDIKEANHLNKVLIQIEKETRNPAIATFLADSYSNGDHGFPKDLKAASQYISKVKSHFGGEFTPLRDDIIVRQGIDEELNSIDLHKNRMRINLNRSSE